MKKGYSNQERFLLKNQFLREKIYWEGIFDGETEKSIIRYDFKMENKQANDILRFDLEKDISEKFIKLSNNSMANLHALLLTCVSILLYKYTGSHKILLGTVIDKQENYEELLNLLLPVKISIENQLSFKEFLLSTKQNLDEAIGNQNFSFIDLAHKYELYVNNKPALFDIAVILNNLHDRKYLKENQQNIVFEFCMSDNRITGSIEYNSALYKKRTIMRIADHLDIICRSVLDDFNITIRDIDLLTDQDYRFIDEYNNTAADYPRDKKVFQLFEETVLRCPHETAIVDDNGKITYNELNRKANRIAGFLLEEKKEQNALIAIMMDRSIDLIAVLLGILKSGSSYIPIDPRYPKARIEHILHDSQASLLFASKDLQVSPDWKGTIIDIHAIDFSSYNPENGNIPVSSSDLAYVIYTSGSTGYPKGVMIEHRSLMNYLCWGAKLYTDNEHVAFPLFTSVSFDLTVTSLFIPLITGNTIIVYTDKNDALLLDKIITDNQVGVIKLTPSHLKLLQNKDITQWKVKKMILGGEKLDGGLLAETVARIDGLEIYNEYGPTEATVGCMIYKYLPDDAKETSVPIGVPADNVHIYLLDKELRYTSPGGTGELYISGDSLARGYLNNPELTDSRFIPNPFIPDCIMYSTGDLGRWNDRGILEYLGRADDQVKMHGFRVELKEIEVNLTEIPFVKDAVAVVRNNESGKHIYAYYISEKDLLEKEIKNELQKRLPHYMIPSYFIRIDQIPLTINGKPDIQALPEYERKRSTLPAESASEKEKVLLKVWKEVLTVDDIRLDDDFFSLGGDSIKSIQISAKLKEYNLEFEMDLLFQYPTVHQLSQFVRETRLQIPQVPVEGEIQLSPIQHWFFKNDFPDPHYFNQSVLLSSKTTIDPSSLETILHYLLSHHDILRTTFKKYADNSIVQSIKRVDEKCYDLVTIDLSGKQNVLELIREDGIKLYGSLNLENGPLVKSALFHADKGDYILIIIHHLLVDGISWRIILEDFFTLYQQVSNNMERKLPLKTSSYKDWTDKLIEYADSPELESEKHYWEKTELLAIPPLFSESESGVYRQYENRHLSFKLTPEYTHQLLHNVHYAFNTEMNDILLSALGLALGTWRNRDRVLINLESHGRENILETIDISRTAGWFTSFAPVVLNGKKSADMEMVVKQTKEMLRGIPHKGIGYSILKYLSSPSTKKGLQFNLSPKINFNYLGDISNYNENQTFFFLDIDANDLVSKNSKRLYALDFQGFIHNTKLHITVNYNVNGIERSEIVRLLDLYSNLLMQIIDLCASKEKTEVTVSDLTADDITEDELHAILDEMEI